MTDAEEGGGCVRVWCFYYVVDTATVALWSLLALGFSAALGLMVGWGAGDGNLGLGAGTGLLAVLTCVQAAIIKWANS
jgi:hypothetical protein